MITSQIIGNTVQGVLSSIVVQLDQEKSSSKKNAKKENKNTSKKANIDGSETSDKSNNSSNSDNTSINNNTNSTTSATSTTNQNIEKKSGGDKSNVDIAMNVDARQENGSSGKSKNPIIISSDLTSAQNLDKSFTGIINIGMSQSSLTGMKSWAVTSMTWFNLKQFAINGRYSSIKFSKNGNLKYVSNYNLTAVYSYGNLISFLGYSGILNAGKYGIAGFNISGAYTLITEDEKKFLSPTVTAFYTKPIIKERFTISPEIYVISTPVIYSSVDKVTQTDRTFSFFIGTGFVYQLTKRFNFNFNYKLNTSTDPTYPILNFFLIGAKVNI